MIGRTISHYTIEEKLGEGGMGVVYRALDTTLRRNVAIKFLSPQALPTSEDEARFGREARAAASLSHPNAATIFEFGETEDPESAKKISFIVMEFVEGVTLSTKIAERPLPVQDVLAIALGVGEALSKAQEKGIVHRDIKPENIMISADGVVKVMDFGLADLAGSSRVTRVGTTVGTAAYMSPEQSRGERVDGRSDLWSLGIVIYEMLTGKRPFGATYEQALVYQILNEEPEPPTSLRSNIPIELERIVKKLIQKDPSQRYQSASELLVDLRSVRTGLETAQGIAHITGASPTRRQVFGRKQLYVGAGIICIAAVTAFVWKTFFTPAASQITSLAVLPFENISPDSGQEYFADGMTDQLISELCRIHSLRVISRTSAMQFKGRHLTVAEIARTLGVEGIITATVFRSGDRMRVNAQLIRARDEASLWNDSYDRRIADVLDLTATLARSIATEIQAALTPSEVRVLSGRRPVDPEAFDLVARANFLLTSSADNQNLEKGMELMQKATHVDPLYIEGYVGVAYAYLALHSFGYRSGPEIFDQAKANLDRAIAIDPTHGRAHSFLGQLLWIKGDIAGCLAEHVEAATLSPNDGLVRTLYSWSLMAQGRFGEGIKEAEIAVTLDPLAHFARCNLMGWYYCDRRYADARREAKSILEMDPNWVPAQETLMWIAYREGRLDDAVGEARKLWLMSDSLAVPAGLSWTQYVDWALSTLERQKGDSRIGMLAMYNSVKGEKDKAMANLERAAEIAHPITLLLFYPEFDSLRGDPRFAEFISRINLPVAAYCDIDRLGSHPDSSASMARTH